MERTTQYLSAQDALNMLISRKAKGNVDGRFEDLMYGKQNV